MYGVLGKVALLVASSTLCEEVAVHPNAVCKWPNGREAVGSFTQALESNEREMGKEGATVRSFRREGMGSTGGEAVGFTGREAMGSTGGEAVGFTRRGAVGFSEREDVGFTRGKATGFSGREVVGFTGGEAVGFTRREAEEGTVEISSKLPCCP